MKRVIAVGFVLLLTAGTAFAAATADPQGSFLDRAASFFGLRAKNPPAPGASVPSGRTALDSRPPLGGPSCTCVGPGGNVIVGVPSDPNDPNSPCDPLGPSGGGIRIPVP